MPYKPAVQGQQGINPQTGLDEPPTTPSKYMPSTSEFKVSPFEENVVKGIDTEKYEKYVPHGSVFINEGLEDARAYGQSTGEQWRNGFLKFAGKTATATLGGTVGAVIGLPAIFNENKSVYDNQFQQWLDKTNEAMDDKLPNYATSIEKEEGFLKSLNNANFWANDVLSGLSFTAGAVLTEMVWSAATAATLGAAGVGQAGVTASLLARAPRYLKNFDKGTDAIKQLQRVKNLQKVDDVGRVMRQVYTGAGYEAGVEARHHKKELTDLLTAEWFADNPGVREIPDEERARIDDVVTTSANGVFAANAVIVGLSNAIALPKIFGPGIRSNRNAFSAISKQYKEVEGAWKNVFTPAYKNASRAKKVAEAAYLTAKNPFIEGVWEEGMQGVANRTMLDYTSKKYNPDGTESVVDLATSFGHGLAETYGGKEGWKEIGIGIIIGSIGSPNLRAIKRKDGKFQKQEGQPLWTGGIAGEFQNRSQRRRKADAVAKNLNDFNQEKFIEFLDQNPELLKSTKSLFEHNIRSESLNKEMDKAVDAGNMFESKNVEHDLLHSYIMGRVEGGFGADLTDEFAATVENMTDEEFASTFNYDLKEEDLSKRKREVLDNFKKRVDRTMDIVNTIDNTTNFNQSDPKQKNAREALIYGASVIENVEQREQELADYISEQTGVSYNKEQRGEEYKKEFTQEISNALKENPVHKAEVLQAVEDLSQLQARREAFITQYNRLHTKEGQDEYGRIIEETLKQFEDELFQDLKSEYDGTVIVVDSDTGKRYKKHTRSDEVDVMDEIDENGKIIPDTQQKITVDKEFIGKYRPEEQNVDGRVLNKDEAGRLLKKIKAFTDPEQLTNFIKNEIKPLELANIDLVRIEAGKKYRELTGTALNWSNPRYVDRIFKDKKTGESYLIRTDTNKKDTYYVKEIKDAGNTKNVDTITSEELYRDYVYEKSYDNFVNKRGRLGNLENMISAKEAILAEKKKEGKSLRKRMKELKAEAEALLKKQTENNGQGRFNNRSVAEINYLLDKTNELIEDVQAQIDQSIQGQLRIKRDLEYLNIRIAEEENQTEVVNLKQQKEDIETEIKDNQELIGSWQKVVNQLKKLVNRLLNLFDVSNMYQEKGYKEELDTYQKQLEAEMNEYLRQFPEKQVVNVSVQHKEGGFRPFRVELASPEYQKRKREAEDKMKRRLAAKKAAITRAINKGVESEGAYWTARGKMERAENQISLLEEDNVALEEKLVMMEEEVKSLRSYRKAERRAVHGTPNRVKRKNNKSLDENPATHVFSKENEVPTTPTQSEEESKTLWDGVKRSIRNVFNGLTGSHVQKSGELTDDVDQRRYYRWTSKTNLSNGEYSIKIVPAFKEDYQKLRDKKHDPTQAYYALVVDKEGKYITENGEPTTEFQKDRNIYTSFPLATLKTSEFGDKFYTPSTKKEWKKLYPNLSVKEAEKAFEIEKEELRSKHNVLREDIKKRIANKEEVIFKLVGKGIGVPNENESYQPGDLPGAITDILGHERVDILVNTTGTATFDGGVVSNGAKGITFVYDKESGNIFEGKPRRLNGAEIEMIINMFRLLASRAVLSENGNIRIPKNSAELFRGETVIEGNMFKILNDLAFWTGDNLKANLKDAVNTNPDTLFHFVSSLKGKDSIRVGKRDYQLFVVEEGKVILNEALAKPDNSGDLYEFLSQKNVNINATKLENVEDEYVEITSVDPETGQVITKSHKNYKSYLIGDGTGNHVLGLTVHPGNVDTEVGLDADGNPIVEKAPQVLSQYAIFDATSDIKSEPATTIEREAPSTEYDGFEDLKEGDYIRVKTRVIDSTEFVTDVLLKVEADGSVTKVIGRMSPNTLSMVAGILNHPSPRHRFVDMNRQLKNEQNGEMLIANANPTTTKAKKPAKTIKTTEETVNVYAGENENTELSNFAKRPFITEQDTWEEGEFTSKYNTVEGAFQAYKLIYTERNTTLDFSNLNEEDRALVEKLKKATGAQAKKLGRTVKGLNTEAWDEDSSDIMEDLIYESFKQNPNAAQKLLATGNATITHTQDKRKWGTEFPKILMEVRELLRSKTEEVSSTDPNDLPTYDEGQGGANLNRTPTGESRVEDISEAEAWFNKRFPTVDFKVVKHLIDGKHHGQLRRAAVYLYENAETGTTFHEAFHVVTQLFLNRRERRALYREYRQRVPKDKNLTDTQIEEILAEDFREFMLSKRESSTETVYAAEPKTQEQIEEDNKYFNGLVKEFNDPKTSEARKIELDKEIASLYYSEGEMVSFDEKKVSQARKRRMEAYKMPLQRNFFERLWNYIVDFIYGKRSTILEVFDKIDNNEYKNDTPQISYDQGLVHNRTPKGKDEVFSRAAMEGINFFFFQRLFANQQNTNSLFSKASNRELVEDIYDYAKDQIGRRMNDLVKQIRESKDQDFINRQTKVVHELNYMLTNWSSNRSYDNPVDRANYSIKGLHRRFLSQYKLEFINIEDNVQELDTNADPDNLWAIESLKFSSKLNASRNIKLLLGTLAEVDSNQRVVLNEISLPHNSDFAYTFNILANKLAGMREADQMRAGMVVLAKTNPYLFKLMKDRLKFDVPTTALSKNDMLQQVQFVQTFAKAKNNYKMDIVGANGHYKVFDSNLTSVEAKIEQAWKNNSNEDLFKVIEDLKVYNPTKFNDITTPDTMEKALAFLSRLGIEFSVINAEESDRTLVKRAQGLYNQVTSGKQVSIFETEVETNANNDLKYFVEQERLTTIDFIENSHFNIDNNLVYDITLNSFISNILNDIEQFDTLDEFLNANPHLKSENNRYVTNSLLLRKGGPLFDTNGNRIKDAMIYEIHEGSKESVSGIAKEFEDLGEPDQLRVFINRGLKGAFPMLRPADNSIERFFNFKKPFFSNARIAGGIEDGSEHIAQMVDYLKDELLRANDLLFNADPDARKWKNLDNDERVKQGILISIVSNNEIVRTELETFFESADYTPEAFFDNEGVMDEVEAEIKAYFRRQVDEMKLLAEDLGIVEEQDNGDYYNNGLNIEGNPSTVTAKRFDTIIQNFIVNDTISNIEQTKLIFGDPINFKSIEDQFKRHSGFVGTKKISAVYSQLNEWIARNMTRTDRDAPLTKDGQPLVRTAIFADVLSTSKYLSQYRDAIKDKADPYDGMEEGDAQGYISIDEWREMLMRSGDWTFGAGSLEDLYQYEIQKENGIKNPAYPNDDLVEPGRVIDPNVLPVATPLKPQYMGPLATNESVTGFYKTSLFPLLPSVTKDFSQLEQLRQAMKHQGIGIAMFDTGSKGATRLNENGEIQPFYNAKGEFDYNNKDIVTQDTYYKHWGIQQDMGFKLKRRVVSGTQMAKQIINGIYENGKANNEKLGALAQEYLKLNEERIKIGLAQLIDDLGLVKEGENYKIDNLDNIIRRFTKEAINRELPDNIVDAIENLKKHESIDALVNREKIENILLAIADSMSISQKRSGAPKVQVSNAIGKNSRTYSENGRTWSPSDLDFYHKEVIDEDGTKRTIITQMEVYLPAYMKGKVNDPRLLNLIGFRIPTQGLNSIESIKVKGFLPVEAGDMVIVPSEIVAKSGSDFDIDKLNLYFPNFFYDQNGDPIYIELKDEAGLKEDYELFIDSYNSRLLKTLIADQVTDNKAALAVVRKEIKNLFKSGIFRSEDLAEELTQRVEQLDMSNSLAHTGNSQQRYMYSAVRDVYEQTAKLIIENEFSEYDALTFDEFRKKAIENRISEVQKEIITHPDNFAQLINPISAEELSQEALEILYLKGEAFKNKEGKLERKPATMNNIVERKYLLSVARRFIGGKQAIGITAIHSTFDILAKMADIYVNPEILMLVKGKAERISTRMNLSHNMNETDNISLAKLMDADNIGNIPERLSQWINAAVDAAKDPFMFDLNSGPETLNTVLYLTMAGVPLKQLTRFMTQPIIIDFVKNRQKWESQMMEANTSSSTDPITNVTSEESKKKFRDEIISITMSPYVNTVFGKYTPKEEVDKYMENRTKSNFTINELESNIKQGARGTLTKAFAESQIQILDDFIHYQDVAKELGNVIRSINYDTNAGGKNTSEMMYRLESTENERIDNTLGNFDTLLEKGFISSYYETVQEINKMVRPLFSSLKDDIAMNQFKRLFRILFDTRNNIPTDKKIRVVDKFKQSFLSYLIVSRPYKIAGESIGKDGTPMPMNTQINALFKGTKEKPNIARRLQVMQEKYPKMELLKYLQANIDPESETDHVITAAKKLDNIDSNTLTNEWKELLSQDKEFAYDLVTATMLQYGILNSPFTFAELIPFEIYGDIVSSILEGEKGFSNNERAAMYNDFFDQFFFNNYDDDAIVPKFKSKRNPLIKVYPFYKRNRAKAQYRSAIRDKKKFDALKAKGVNVWERTPTIYDSETNKPIPNVGLKDYRNKQLLLKYGVGQTSRVDSKSRSELKGDNTNEFFQTNTSLYNLAARWGMQESGFFNNRVDENLLKQEIYRRGFAAKGIKVVRAANGRGSLYLKDGRGIIKPGRMQSQYGQLSQSTEEVPNHALNEKIKEWMTKMGISYQNVENITDSQGNTVDAIAKADMLNRIIQVVEGKADITTLPEEAAHFLVELLGEDNPILKMMMNVITDYDVYNEVVAEYGALYDNDEVKLRKEAVGKMIAKTIVKKEKVANMSRFQRAWDSAWRWIKKHILGRVSSTEVQDELAPFSQAADMILTGSTEGLSDIGTLQGNEFFQVSVTEEQKKRRDEVVKNFEDNRVDRDRERGGYKTGDGTKIRNRVTDAVKEFYKRVYRNKKFTPEQEKYNAILAQKGTILHKYLEYIGDAVFAGKKPDLKYIERKVIEDLTDKNDVANEEFLSKDASFFKLRGSGQFGELVRGMKQIQSQVLEKQKKIDPKGEVKFFPELIVYDQYGDVGGTVDLAVVYSNGVVGMYDYKGIKFNATQTVPTIKERAYSIQLMEYKKVLSRNYGVKDFGETRIVPIDMKIGQKTHGFDNIKMGATGLNDTERPYLNQIPVAGEMTDDKNLNISLRKMLNLYDVLVEELEADYKNEKLRIRTAKLKEAIKALQLKGDVSFIFGEINALYSDFQARENLVAENPNALDNDFLNDVEMYLDVYDQFGVNAMEAAKKTENETERQELVANLERVAHMLDTLRLRMEQKRAENLNRDEDYDVTGSAPAESAMGRVFKQLSQFNRPVFKKLSSMIREISDGVRREVNEVVDNISEKKDKLQEWARGNGLTLQQAYDKIINNKTGNLVAKFSKKYYEDRAVAIEKKNVKWFLDNAQVEKGSDGKLRYSEELQKKFEEARKTQFDYIERTNKGDHLMKFRNALKKQWNQRFDISEETTALFNPTNWFIKPQEKAENFSDEYNYMKRPENEALFDFYNMYVKYNQEFAERTGKDISDNFVAEISKDLIDRIGQAGIHGITEIKDAVARSIEIRDHDTTRGVINPSTGQPMQSIPLFYSTKLVGRLSSREKNAIENDVKLEFKEGTEEYDEALETALRKAEYDKGTKSKSRDLSRSLVLFAEAAYTHEQLSLNESTALALRNSMKAQGQETELVDPAGKTLMNKFTRKVATMIGVPTSEQEAMEKFIKLYWYGQTTQGKDVTWGDGKYSATKSYQLIMKLTSATALGLKPILAAGNLLGIKSNYYMTGREGRFYNGKDIHAAHKMFVTRDSNYKVLIDFFAPHTKDITWKKANDLSVSKIVKHFTNDNLYFMHRKGDEMIDNNVLIAMMHRYGIDSVDGKVRRIDKIKGEDKRTLMERFSVVDDKVSIEGLTDKQYTRFRAMTQTVAVGIKGNMPEEDRNLIGTSLSGQALMQFRNWMPGLITKRFKNLQYDHLFEDYDVGRFRVFFGEFSAKGVLPKLKVFTTLLGEVSMMNLYEKKGPNMEVTKKFYDKYMLNNPDSTMTIDEFIELRKDKLKGMARELQIYLSFMLMVFGGKAMLPEDEENPMLKLLAQNAFRITQRGALEISFFFEPSSVSSILKSPVPSLRFFLDLQRMLVNTYDETRDVIFGENSQQDKANRMYYFSKLVPVSSSAVDFFDIFDTYNKNRGY